MKGTELTKAILEAEVARLSAIENLQSEVIIYDWRIVDEENNGIKLSPKTRTFIEIQNTTTNKVFGEISRSLRILKALLKEL